MKRRVFGWRFCGLFTALAALASLIAGCGTSATPPPGGTQAVAYWHQLLQRYPDLPAKVEAIVQQRRSPNAAMIGQAEVRVYGADKVVAVRGRHVAVVVTDLDEATLKKLLAWWKEVPRLARELNVDFPAPLELPENTRHIVVLGSDGYVAVQGPSGNEVQSIRIIDDQVAAQTTIAVHAFGPEGETALSQLGGAYDRVRGPPDAEVRSGHIGLPPPEDNVTILVVGQLSRLDIAGPTDYAQQDISFSDFVNRHQSGEQLSGTLAGQPFGRSPEYVAEQPRATYAEPALNESTAGSESTSSGSNSSNNFSSTAPSAAIPAPYQPNNFQVPETYRPQPLPYDPSRQLNPVVVPNPAPVGGGYRFVPRYGGS